MPHIDRIHKVRKEYQDKLREQLDELMFVSVEGNKEAHRRLFEDFETNVIILWRFDRKLQNATDGALIDPE